MHATAIQSPKTKVSTTNFYDAYESRFNVSILPERVLSKINDRFPLRCRTRLVIKYVISLFAPKFCRNWILEICAYRGVSCDYTAHELMNEVFLSESN